MCFLEQEEVPSEDRGAFLPLACLLSLIPSFFQDLLWWGESVEDQNSLFRIASRSSESSHCGYARIQSEKHFVFSYSTSCASRNVLFRAWSVVLLEFFP